MDVENQEISSGDKSPCEESEKEVDSDEDVQEVCVVPPSMTPSGKVPCTLLNGQATVSPQTLSNSKKRKRLSSKEREERERERAEKRAKLEEEKQRKEEEKQKREQERLAKLKQKEEERLKREEEKNKKEEERKKKLEELEKQKRLREEERKKKQEEEEKKKKEKEEERKKKLEEEEKKKKEKEDERLKKIEEKKQKDLELQQKQEEKEKEKKKDEEKLAKQAKMFTSFFQKSPGSAKGTPRRISLTKVSDINGADGEDSSGSSSSVKAERIPNLFNPMMFEVKSNMRMAPVVRRKLTTEQVRQLEQLVLNTQDDDDSEPMEVDTVASKQPTDYLKKLKSQGGRKSRSEVATSTAAEPDVQIIGNTIIENPKAQGLVKWRYKLLQFHTNQRPAYWGTWKKLPASVKARTPFRQEKDLDYDFDSDDEWEEEPEDGEELGDSEKDDDPDKDEVDEDDEDGWLVPHGYISDDEGSVDEHLDKETLKIEEKNYFDGLKKQIKIKLPEIQTVKLSDYRIIFSPLRHKWRETCAAANKAAEAAKSAIMDTSDVITLT